MIDVCHFYRPQRSWGKVIFSQASVILIMGGGGGCLLPGGVCSGRCPLRRMPALGGGACSWGGGACSWEGGACSGGVSAPGGGMPAPGGGVPAPRGVACSQGGLLWGGVETPPRCLLLRVVRILLECILVTLHNFSAFVSLGLCD